MRLATEDRVEDVRERTDRGVTLAIVAAVIALMLAFGLGPNFLIA